MELRSSPNSKPTDNITRSTWQPDRMTRSRSKILSREAFRFRLTNRNGQLLSRKRRKLLRKNIHERLKMNSGSKVLKKQFLMMRAIWPACQSPDEFLTDMEKYNPDTVWQTASQVVDGSAEFTKYFNLISRDKTVTDTLTYQNHEFAGSLMPVLRYQRLCNVVPAPAYQHAPASLTVRRLKRHRTGIEFQ